MHVSLGLILLVFSFVLALVASAVPEWRGWKVAPIAFAFFVASLIFGGVTLG
jgi:hypothetical protein